MLSQSEQEQVNSFVDLISKQRATLSDALSKAEALKDWDCRPPSGIFIFDWYSLLCKRLKDTKRRFLVTSPEIRLLLEHSRDYKLVNDNNLEGIYQVGELGKTLLVFVDPYFPMDQILLGNGSLDDPENLVVRDPLKIRVTHQLDNTINR